MQTNYLSPEATGYTAIRVPMAKQDKTTTQNRESADLEKLKQKCLAKLRKYDEEDEEIDSLLSCLKQLNKTVGVRPEILSFYEKTLLEKPWKKCDCPICSRIGIRQQRIKK